MKKYTGKLFDLSKLAILEDPEFKAIVMGDGNLTEDEYEEFIEGAHNEISIEQHEVGSSSICVLKKMLESFGVCKDMTEEDLIKVVVSSMLAVKCIDDYEKAKFDEIMANR